MRGPTTIKNLEHPGQPATYGQRKPVVVNRRTGAVEAGNGTLRAPCRSMEHLAAVFVDDDQAVPRLRPADNRSAETGRVGTHP